MVRSFLITILLSLTPWLTMAQHLTFSIPDNQVQQHVLSDYSPKDPYEMQFGVTVEVSDDKKPLQLSLENTQSFIIGKRRMERMRFVYEGKPIVAFLQQLYAEIDGVKVYRYYISKTQYVDMVKMSDAGELTPLADNPAQGIVSPLREHLYSYPAAKQAEVRSYIDNLPAKYEVLLDMIPLLEMGRVSRLPRLKWGVTAGVALCQLDHDTYDLNTEPELRVGLFADLPFMQSKFSFHPELLVGNYAAKGKLSTLDHPFSSVAYNQTFLTAPLLIRYNYRSLTGLAVPYVELGAEVGYAFRNDFCYRYISTGEAASSLIEGTEKVPNVTKGLLLGLGCEWQVCNHHSIYTSLRGSIGVGDFRRKSLCISVSYNL